jgi:hypothetical protein
LDVDDETAAVFLDADPYDSGDDFEAPPQRPPTPPLSFSRQDVSGADDFCGAEAVRGLLWSLLGINPSTQLVVYWLVRCQPEDPPQLSNFSSDTIQWLLYRRFGIPTSLVVNGRIYPVPSYQDEPTAPTGTLYLTRRFGSGHYNYFGIPLPSGPPSDANIPASLDPTIP